MDDDLFEEFTSLILSSTIPGNSVFTIDLRDLWLSRDNWVELYALFASALENKHNRVRELLLDSNVEGFDLPQESALLLASALTHENNKIQVLKLGKLEVGGREFIMSAFVAALKHPNCQVLHTELRRSYFTLEDIASVLSFPHTRLVYLDLSAPIVDFTFGGFTSLSSALASPNNRLRTLALRRCTVNSRVMDLLAPGLVDNNCLLEELDLQGNLLGADGAAVLTRVLAHPNSKLKQVNLASNDIRDDGALHLALALAKCPRPVFLLLLGNQIRGLGASALAQACCQEENRVDHLVLTSNDIGLEGAKAIASALTNPFNHLTTLSLAYTNLGPEGAQALAQALSQVNNRVARLNVRGNAWGVVGTKSLAQALTSEHNKVVELNLQNNYISSSGALALVECLAHENNRVERLEVMEMLDAGIWVKLVRALEGGKLKRLEAIELSQLFGVDSVLDEIKHVLTQQTNRVRHLEFRWTQGEEPSPEASMEMKRAVQHPNCGLHYFSLSAGFEEAEEEVVRMRVPRMIWVLLFASRGRGKRVAVVARMPAELFRMVGEMLAGIN